MEELLARADARGIERLTEDEQYALTLKDNLETNIMTINALAEMIRKLGYKVSVEVTVSYEE